MLWQILVLLLPFLALFYYLKSNWSDIKDNTPIVSLLIGGTILWFAGLFMQQYNFANGSLLSLVGVCIFFTVIAVHTAKYRKKEKSDDEAE